MKGCAALLLVVLGMLSSCSKQDSFATDHVGPSKPNIEMILTAKHVYSTSPYRDSLLAGVSVQVYSNSYERILHKQPVKYGTTDSVGRVTFEYLNAQDYFVEATYHGTDTARISISYPSGAVASYEDLLMVKH